VKHPRWTHALFSDTDLDAIAAAVTAAEATTSAEIRVHLERRLPRGATGAEDALERARTVFVALGMQATAERSGVLLYLAIDDHRVAIVGDDGVHARVGPGFWDGVRDVMVERLRRGASRDAVIAAVADLGAVLRRFFPRRGGDTDELSDRVSLG
jgi:uncharacterized membrane protein